MKRIFCSLFIFSSLFIQISYSQDFYALGVTAYKSAKYDIAIQNFEAAIKLNPQDVNARYYLAQAYLKQNYIADAKKQYNKIIMLAPDSNAAILAQKGLSLIRRAELDTSNRNKIASNPLADNYLVYVLTDGRAKKWENFPISVYIPQNSYKASVQKAFSQWQSETKGLIKFIFTESKNAQIIVTFKNSLEKNASDENFVAGYSKPYYQNGFLSKSEISLLTVDPQTKENLPDDMIYFAALHEIGHSLGFNGHSPDEKDVMASASEDVKENLTKRDINTIKLFYTLDEDSIKALSTNSKDLKLQQLLAYVKQFPNSAVSWSNLADYYRGQGQYQEAILNYKKAISIEPNNAETYNLIGMAYSLAEDKQNAYKSLKRACDLDKDNEFYLYQFLKSCSTTEEKSEAQKYLKDFLKAHPDKANDEKFKI